MKTQKTIEDSFYTAGLILLLLCLAGRISYIWHPIRLPGCLFHLLTGYYCPGCGGTRAVAALVHGHFIRSVYYHPFVLYIVCVGGWFMLSQTVERLSRHKIKIGMHYHDRYVWTAVVIILLNCVLKNVLHYAIHLQL